MSHQGVLGMDSMAGVEITLRLTCLAPRKGQDRVVYTSAQLSAARYDSQADDALKPKKRLTER